MSLSKTQRSFENAWKLRKSLEAFLSASYFAFLILAFLVQHLQVTLKRQTARVETGNMCGKQLIARNSSIFNRISKRIFIAILSH